MNRNRFHTWQAAICESDLPSTTRLVLFTLGTFMNQHGRSCYPSIEDVQKASGIKSKTTVIDHIERACAAGFLKKGRHGYGGQKWKRAEYEAAFPEALTPPEGGPDYEPPSAANALPKAGPADEPPLPEAGPRDEPPCVEGGPANEPKAVQQMDQDKNNPFNNPSSLSDRPAGETANGEEREVEFEDFWESYPSTGAGSRDAALSAWRKLSPADRRAAVKAAKTLREPQTLYPALFLSERRWTPAIAPVAPSQPKRPEDPTHGRIWDRFEAARRLSFWAKALSPDHIAIEGSEIVPIARTVRHHLAHDPEARRLLSGLGLTVRPKQFRPPQRSSL